MKLSMSTLALLGGVAIAAGGCVRSAPEQSTTEGPGADVGGNEDVGGALGSGTDSAVTSASADSMAAAGDTAATGGGEAARVPEPSAVGAAGGRTSSEPAAVRQVLARSTLAAKSGSNVRGSFEVVREKAGAAAADTGPLVAVISIEGATPGEHGVHVHEKGDCSAPDAASAGAHYDPTHGKHAGPDASGRHAGDLGNITVDAHGAGHVEVKLGSMTGVDFSKDFVGRSIVVHEKVDDLKTQPSGNSGARIACGVIEKGSGEVGH